MVQLRKYLGLALASIIVLLVVIQIIPYGRNHTNPPVRMEPAWPSQEVRNLAVRACYACHSNETTWPWYSNIAPASWLIQRDVDEGRRELNYSEWDRPQKEARESAKTVREGEMPQWYYVLLHPSANLSSTERASLIQGFETMFGAGER
ncbi:MAG: cytochrome C [Chloroflexota bacterium]|nr:MAG: cytochrome C [Chloroflexota bacterium]